MRVIKDNVLLRDFADTKGRKYAQAEIMSQVSGKTLYGELISDSSNDVNLNRVSHIVENARVVDGSLVADIRVLDTPMGKIVESLIDNGILIKTSIRATGMVGDDNTVTDLKLITFDILGVA